MAAVTEQQIVVDRDVQAVLEFMQARVATGKLVAVATSVYELGRLLWAIYPPQSLLGIQLMSKEIRLGDSQPNATGLTPGHTYVDGGFEEGVDVELPT